MKKVFKQFFSKTYSNKEWQLMKLFFILFSIKFSHLIIFNIPKIQNNIGICNWINCQIIQDPTFKILLFLIVLLLALLYFFDIAMVITNLLLGVIFLFLITSLDAAGINARSNFLPFIFFVQVLAYGKFKITKNIHALKQDRIQYVVQILTVIYITALYTKIANSGFEWVNHNSLLALNAKKGILHFYATHGGAYLLNYSTFMFKLLYSNKILVQFILIGTLIIEFLAFFSLINKRSTIFLGLFIILMHLSIFIIMMVFVEPITVCVTIFIFNLPYLLYLMLSTLFNRLIAYKN